MSGEKDGRDEHAGGWFQTFAAKSSHIVGTKWAFATAIVLIAVWCITGPIFKYSNTWQLVINTLTTIITFLMVFLIQNTQNRDARALHLKLDEIIRSIQLAHNEMIDIEKLSDSELEELSKHFEAIRSQCEKRKLVNPRTTNTPEKAASGPRSSST